MLECDKKLRGEESFVYSCLVLPRRVVFSFWEVTVPKLVDDREMKMHHQMKAGKQAKSEVRHYQHKLFRQG